MNKNYAGMAEDKGGDCVSLGLRIRPNVLVKFLGDFAGGEAILTDGASGYDSSYTLVASDSPESIALFRDGKLEFYLYGVRSKQRMIDSNGDSYFPGLPLEKGQILSLVHKSNPYKSIELRLNGLFI